MKIYIISHIYTLFTGENNPSTFLLKLRQLKAVFALLGIFLAGYSTMHAQVLECGTNITPEEIAYMKQFQEEIQRFQLTPEQLNRSVARVPITAHIIRKSDGTDGLTETELNDAIASANVFYQNANIEFFLCTAINYIDSDQYYDFKTADDAILRVTYNVSNTINIYFANSLSDDQDRYFCGYTNFPGGPDRIMMANSCTTNGSTFSHELGHYFSLYHTHGKTNTGTTDELVDGSNCTTAGDDVCDTPADPNLSGQVTESCVYTGTAVDANGQAFSPMVSNIMSYARKACRTQFTAGQYNRIAWTYLNQRAYLDCSQAGAYCDAKGAQGTGSDYISSVSLHTLSNPSGKTDYSDFTSLSTTLERGESYTLEIGLRSVFSLDAAYGWIDFDQDGKFEAEEAISMSAFNSDQKSQGTFVVPASAVAGSTRLRVRNIYTSSQIADPCGDYFGEVEDYAVVIQDLRPDYRPTKITGPPTVAAGESITVQVTINNNGNTDGLGNNGKDKYYISSSSNLNASNLGTNAIFLNEYDTDNINAGETKQYPGGFNIPATLTPGQYFIYYFLDADNRVDESNEDNNIISYEISVTEPPIDLQVDFSANKTTLCVGESVQFTSVVSGGNPKRAYDFSGNGNHGELQNMESPYIERTSYGKALNFGGIDDYVILPENLTTEQQNFTFETWFFTGTVETWDRIFDFGTDISNFISLTPSSAWNDYKPQFHNRFGGEYQVVNYPDAVVPNTWYHFAIVWDVNGLVKLYLNGELKTEQTISKKPADIGNFTNNFLGKSQYPSDRLFGQLDEFRIWSTARTQAEIQANKDKELTGNESGLLAYYNFNQNIPSSELTYLWGFNGPETFVSDEPNPTVTFSAPATYTVSLTVSDGTLNKTETKTDYITIQGCEPDWQIIETADYHLVLIPNNADIKLEGQNISVGDYIGAFYNDNGILKCAGKAKWTGAYLAMTVFGDDGTTTNKDGFDAGESFQWKVWQASTNQEFFGTATYQAPAGNVTHTGQFAVNGISQINRLIGTTQPPQAVTQTITLEPGWNYISSYIISSQTNMSAIFNEIQADIVIVKNGQGAVYMPTPFINDIGNWNVVHGYQVKLNGTSPKQLTLTGEKVNLANTSIPFTAGHNLFAYLKETEQPVQVAMAPIANEIELITDEKGRAYIPSFRINNIGNMKPGKGYWAKMKSAVSLNYTARIATPPVNMHTSQLIPRHYRLYRKGAYHATMLLNTKGLVSLGDEVGVFDTKGQLVGAATYENHLIAFPIWGDDPTTDEIDGLEEGAGFEIRVWNKATGLEQIFIFEANVNSYTKNSVIEAELLRTTNTTSLLKANSLNLYPNPTRNHATLSLNLKSQATVEVTLFDLAGKQLLPITEENKTAGNHEWKLNTSSLSTGLYHCKVIVDGIIHNIPFSVVK